MGDILIGIVGAFLGGWIFRELGAVPMGHCALPRPTPYVAETDAEVVCDW
jgi:transglycosylase associated protein